MSEYEQRLFLALVLMALLYQLTRMYSRLYYSSEAIEKFSALIYADNLELRAKAAKPIDPATE